MSERGLHCALYSYMPLFMIKITLLFFFSLVEWVNNLVIILYCQLLTVFQGSFSLVSCVIVLPENEMMNCKISLLE